MSIIACILDTCSLASVDIIAELALETGGCAITQRTLAHGRAVVGRTSSIGACWIVTSITDGAGCS